MIPISELPEISTRLASELDNFEQQFRTFAATYDEVRELALQFGEGIWYSIKPKLDHAISAAEHTFGAEHADGWTAVLTIKGWMFHRGGSTN